MPALTLEQILSADDLKRERVDVNEWGGYVYVRTLTGTERDRFETQVFSERGKDNAQNRANFRAHMCALVMVNDDGKKIVASKEDIAALGKKSCAALQRVFDVSQRLNGITPADVDELTKNLDETGDGASSSASPSPSAAPSANSSPGLTAVN